MFGSKFWDNALLEATHWNFGNNAKRIREASKPPITREFWTAEFNRKLQENFSLKRNLSSVFIDSFHDTNDSLEVEIYNSEAKTLFDFAKSRKPFHCELNKTSRSHLLHQFLILCCSGKDIEIALTEIQELQMKLGNLTTENFKFKSKISILENENKKLNRYIDRQRSKHISAI